MLCGYCQREKNTMQASDPTTKLGKGFAWIAWLLLLAVVYLLFDDAISNKLNPNQQLQSGVSQNGSAQVTLTRNSQGHYVGTLKLNGVDTVFSKAGIPVDITIVRENIEDTYGGVEHLLTRDVAVGRRYISRAGSEQVHRFAFEMARKEGFKKVAQDLKK